MGHLICIFFLENVSQQDGGVNHLLGYRKAKTTAIFIQCNATHFAQDFADKTQPGQAGIKS